ncbi:hypothetical protein CTP10_R69510 (plasmid) [Cupriavidus sp. P-10]|nr:hypothetical protein CTP10_R69510 [Cupriavidus sp. P-10]
MKVRVFTLLWLAAMASGGMLPPTPAHAGVFDDEQARRTVITLRDQFNSFQATATQRIEQNSRTTLDLQNQLEGLRLTTAMTAKTERAAAIRWIQAEMADYGLTMEELAAAGCFDPPPPAPVPPPVVCYRNAAGQSWDGQGDMPDWLRRAVNAGQSVEFLPGRVVQEGGSDSETDLNQVVGKLLAE